MDNFLFYMAIPSLVLILMFVKILINSVFLLFVIGYIPAKWEVENNYIFGDCVIKHNGLSSKYVIDEGDTTMDFKLILPWYFNFIF